ncbi:hypothetical protein D3C72_1413190 [compost metagenome]
MAPSSCANGSLGDRRPLVKICSVRVSRPWVVLVVLSWAGVGARKPVDRVPRRATSGVIAKRADSLPSTVLPKLEKSS